VLRLLRQVSLRQLRTSGARTGLVIGGTATGVALMVAIAVVNHTVLASFRRTLELIAGPAQLEITLGSGEVGFSEAVVDAARADPGVEAALGLVRGTVALADGRGEPLQLFGVDLTQEHTLERYRIALSGDRSDMLEWLADPRSVALTATFAARHGLAVGDRVRLSTRRGLLTATVRGLLVPEGLARAFGGALAVMDLPAAQMVLGKDRQVDQVDLLLRPGAVVEEVQSRLAAALPSTLAVAPPLQRGALYENVLASFQAMLTGLSLLCLVAGVYLIYNTTSTGAVHRALVLASLRLTGAEPARLFRLLMLEAGILGVVGTAIGIPAGLVLGRLLLGAVSTAMGIVFQLTLPVERLTPDPWALARVAVTGILAALFASWFAARRVTALEPLDVLRADPRTLAPRARPARLAALWAALVALSAVALLLEVRLKSVGWGNAGSTLWWASSIVVAVPLVHVSAAMLARVLARWFGPAGQVAAASLLRAPTRAGITVAAIALVLTVAITVASLSQSHRNSVRSYFVDGFLASDLSVSSVATEGGWLESPIPGSVATEVRMLPGVRRTEMWRVLPGVMFRGERIAVAAGTDGLFDPARYPRSWYRAGDPEAAARAIRAGRGANVSESFADRFGARLGDVVTLDTPTGVLALPIVGVVPDYISNRGTVLLARRLFIDRWRETTVNRIHVFLEPGARPARVRKAILERLGDWFGDRYRMKVQTMDEGVAYLAAKIDQAYAFTAAIQLLVVLVTLAGIFDLLLADLWERRRELALWRVIGADERVVRRSVVIESATLGGLGALLGVAVGVVTTWMWVRVNYRYLLGYYLDLHFAVGTSAWFVALVIVATVAAGWGAARHATRQPILDGIQVE
jgi:putative ABC transport system permease protein